MSQENVERVRRSYELFLDRAFDAFLTTIDPDIGWDFSAHPLVDVSNYGRGHDALMTMFATYMSGWTDYSAELKELVDAGDQVVVVLHETAKMGGTGVPLDRDIVHVITVRDGRSTFIQVFRTKAEALEAAGLSE